MPFTSRVAALHGALWSLDRGYRLWWYIWPASIALLICGWICFANPAGTTTSSTAPWAKPAPSASVKSAKAAPDLNIWPEKLRGDVRICMNTSSPGPGIEACSRMIESGLMNDWQLVTTRGQRGTYYAKTQPDRALADYDFVLKMDPDNSNALTYRGWVYLSLGRYDAALADLSRAIELSVPELAARARSYRANTYYQLKEYEKAIADLDEAQLREPNNPELYMSRGQIDYAQQRYDAALRNFDEFNWLAPRNPYGLIGRGMVLEATGHPQEALLAYDKVLKLDPTNAWTIAARDRLRLAGDKAAGDQGARAK